MTRILVLILSLLAAPALAQEIYPALHDVTGVAADDVLNVRAEPSAAAEIIGAFSPYETDIEVIALSDDGGWGRVNTGEQAGWTSMNFLARQPGQTAADWSAGLAPVILDCYGTEPFWDMSFTPAGSFVFNDPFGGDPEPMAGTFVPFASPASTAKRGFVGSLSYSATWVTGVVTRAYCSDGMSDRDFGIVLDVIRGGPGGSRLDTGCCRLSR